MIAGHRTEIWTRDLRNTKQECYHSTATFGNFYEQMLNFVFHKSVEFIDQLGKYALREEGCLRNWPNGITMCWKVTLDGRQERWRIEQQTRIFLEDSYLKDQDVFGKIILINCFLGSLTSVVSTHITHTKCWTHNITQSTTLKSCPATSCTRQEGEEVQILLILDLGIRWGEWSTSRPGRALPSEKEPLVPTGSGAGWASELVWTQRLEENSFACAGHTTPVFQSVVWRYTDGDTPAPNSLHSTAQLNNEYEIDISEVDSTSAVYWQREREREREKRDRALGCYVLFSTCSTAWSALPSIQVIP
jgi:hypothetical protein